VVSATARARALGLKAVEQLGGEMLRVAAPSPPFAGERLAAVP